MNEVLVYLFMSGLCLGCAARLAYGVRWRPFWVLWRSDHAPLAIGTLFFLVYGLGLLVAVLVGVLTGAS